ELTAKELMLKFGEIRPELGDKGIKIHIHNFNHKTDYTFYTNEERMQFLNRTKVHVNRLIEGDEMFESTLPLLKSLNHPSLLIRGKYDPVMDEEQRDRFRKDVRNASVITLSNSGHFPHSEEPDEFARSVVNFFK